MNSGRVVYKRTIQPEPFESKTAEVEFSFTVDDGDDPAAVAGQALAMAKAEVHDALGLRGKAPKE